MCRNSRNKVESVLGPQSKYYTSKRDKPLSSIKVLPELPIDDDRSEGSVHKHVDKQGVKGRLVKYQRSKLVSGRGSNILKILST